MREIKFRARRIDNGNWAYGYYAVHKMMLTGEMDYFIIVDEQRPQSVNPETVGQYTGLKDKNGKEICEGDIIRIKHPHKIKTYVGQIIYFGYGFTAKDFYFPHHDNPGDPFESLVYMEVIGNIYENPELLQQPTG